MLLAIDTSTRAVSLAIATPTQLLAEHTWQSNDHHTQQLAPMLASMLQQTGVEMSQIAAVAVAQGPGSFTGLRIGIAMAKGIAIARSIPLYAVPSHAMIAAATPIHLNKQLVAVLPAGRGRVLAARFNVGAAGTGWQPSGDVELLSWPALAATLNHETMVLSGEIAEAGLAALDELECLKSILPVGWRVRRAGFLAQLAPQYPASSPLDVYPLYVKSP